MPASPDHDPFGAFARSADSPARQAALVTPNDTTDLTTYAKALWVNGAGDVVAIPVDNADNASVTFAVADSSLLPVQVRRVLNTGTTATGIIALSD